MVTMKIYNEVVYQIVDDQLVKVYSKGFQPYMDKYGTDATNYMKSNNLESPGGAIKSQVTDVVKDWSGKLEKIAWGTDSTETDDDDDAVAADTVLETDPEFEDPDYLSSDSDAVANLKANRQKQVQMRGRQAANQTQGQSASMLTA